VSRFPERGTLRAASFDTRPLVRLLRGLRALERSRARALRRGRRRPATDGLALADPYLALADLELERVHALETGRLLREAVRQCLDGTRIAALLPNRTRMDVRRLMARLRAELRARAADGRELPLLFQDAFGTADVERSALQLAETAQRIDPCREADLVLAFARLVAGEAALAAHGFAELLRQPLPERLRPSARAGLDEALAR